MASSKSLQSDLLRRPSCSSSSLKAFVASNSSTINRSTTTDDHEGDRCCSTMTVDGGLLHGNAAYAAAASSSESTLLDASIALVEAPTPPARTVDDVWKQIVSGERRECKEEIPDEMMTLEDFLVRAGASVGSAEDEDEDVKPSAERMMSGGVLGFEAATPIEKVEGSIVGFGNGVELIGGGRGKRGASVLEPLDKAAQQRQRRMIKNRESAARSRERKQAYQVELESLAVRLEEENEQLLKEKEERTKERFRQLMEKVIPIVEKPKTARVLRRVQSLQW